MAEGKKKKNAGGVDMTGLGELVPLEPSEDLLAKLTPKQGAYARAYAESGNGTRSAIAAGYSERSASTQASLLNKNPRVQAAVAALRREKMGRMVVSDEMVIRGLLEEASSKGPGSSANARVQSHKLLGEYLGTFEKNQFDALAHIRTIVVEMVPPRPEVLERLIALKKELAELGD